MNAACVQCKINAGSICQLRKGRKGKERKGREGKGDLPGQQAQLIGCRGSDPYAAQ